MNNSRILIQMVLVGAALGQASMAGDLSRIRPNIILVMPDDTGYGDYACLGNPITRTPAVDAFKKESLLFTQFHLSPTCSPSRAALLSGRHEFRCGVTHTIGGRERMNLDTYTLPQMLASVGYTSGIFGKWHIGDEDAYRPESRGFDEVYIHGSGGIGQSGDAPGNTNIDPTLWHNGTFVKTKGYCTDLFFEQAIRWMDEKRLSKQPFFAYIPLNAAHAPHVLPEKDYQQYLGHPRLKEQQAKYFGMVENIDTNFGVLLQKLDQWGIADNTLVIYLGTDNGGTAGRNIFNAGMRGGKASPYQGGTRAPCFVRWPDGGVPAGAQCDALTAHVDLYPTLAEITGATLATKVKTQLEGRSLLPLLSNPNSDWTDRTLVHHVGRWPKGEAAAFKFSKCAIQNSRFTLVNNEELYDLKADPGESANVIAEHPEVVGKLRADYDRWWDDTLPLMVHENVTRFDNFTFRKLYEKQFGKAATAKALQRGKETRAKKARKKMQNSDETDREQLRQKRKARAEKKARAKADTNTGVQADGIGNSERPNIVVFVADDMGWGDSGTYGHELIQTPNLDKLASRGVKLTQCYSACAVCSPSRSAILTGRHPYRNGVWRHLSGKHKAHLRASEITYPKLLKSIGYETCHVGKWHLNSLPQFNTTEFPQPDDHGYDYWMATHNNAHPSHENPDNFVRNGQPIGEQQGYSAQIVAGEAIKWLSEKRDKSKPFALSVWVHEPHSPIATDPKFASLYGDHDNRTYMGNISQLDHAVGQVMQTLDQEGVSNNTLFIFTSDNGPVTRYGGTTGGLRGGKRSDHEGGIRVPGIVCWPGHIAPGTTSSVPVVGTDIFTTVLAITGIPLPTDRTIDGVNILPALAGKPVQRPIPLFWRTHVSRPDDRVAMRIGDWKIVGDDSLTKFQLYEIEKDWQEKNDLATSMPDKTEAMKQQLLTLWKDIETEGPDEWWKAERNRPASGGTLNY